MSDSVRWISGGEQTTTLASSGFCLTAWFSAFVLFVNERATDITFTGLGKINVATKQGFWLPKKDLAEGMDEPNSQANT